MLRVITYGRFQFFPEFEISFIRNEILIGVGRRNFSAASETRLISDKTFIVAIKKEKEKRKLDFSFLRRLKRKNSTLILVYKFSRFNNSNKRIRL